MWLPAVDVLFFFLYLFVCFFLFFSFFLFWRLTLQGERSQRSIYGTDVLSTARIPALGNTIVAVETTIHFVCC
jgi:hypothetical protein